MANRVGQSLGNYKLITLLGEGGYAEVYKGEHIYLGTHAAIKVLRAKVTGDEIEARTIASLEHLNIIKVLDFGIQAGTPFLVMEYAPKGSLREYQPKGRPLPYVVVMTYIKQIAYALQYAHDQKHLIHRDVKPANMLVMNDGRIVLSDFGIAVTAQSGQRDAVGTVHYMAPEQIQSHPEFASDQYALAIVAFEWLSGDLPFQGTEQEIFNQQMYTPPPRLSGKVPASVEKVILHALEKDPRYRFSRVQEFADELENAYQEAAYRAQSTTRPLSSVIPPTPVPSADADSTTVFFSGPIIQPTTPEEMLISRYDTVLKQFHQLDIIYKNELQLMQQSFDQERSKMETALEQEQQQAIRGIESVRDAVRTTQGMLNNSKWDYIVHRQIPTIQASKSLEQMSAAQEDALDARDKISSSVDKYGNRRDLYQRALVVIVVAVIAIAALYGAYALLAWLAHFLGLHLGLFNTTTLIGFLVLVALLLLAVALLWLRDNLATNTSIWDSYLRLMLASSAVEIIGEKQNEALENSKRNRLADHQTRYRYAREEIERKLQASLAHYIPTLEHYKQEDGLLVAGWDDPRWLKWQPPQKAVSLARLGVIAESASFPALPALAICPGRDNILFKVPGIAKGYAVQALQSLMLRLLTTPPPGKLRFTLIDPTGMGENVAAFLQLADYDEQLISGKAWTKKEQIAQQLTELSDHMGDVIQQYLRNQYRTIDEYNKAAGEIAEPYRILVIAGFPANFNKETATLLTNIAATGSRCGVSVIMTVDTNLPLPPGFRLTELERVSQVITWDGQNFNWKYKDIGTCKLWPDILPQSEIFGELLKRIGEAAIQYRQRVEIPFRWAIEQQIIPEYRWWASDQSTSEEIVVPLGRKGATKYQYLRLGKGTAHHVLIVGTTGSGKTNLLHNLIVGLSLIYDPNELELYLVDFKDVGFMPYVHHKLPHARVIAIQSEREYGLSVLQGLEEEIEQRKRLFKDAGVQDITQFRKVRPQVRMPRVLLVIDEFQELFIRRDDIATKAAEHLNRFVRTGRGFGIHVILASQTLAGLSSLGRPTLLDRSTMSQMTVRIAMKNEKADSHLILSEDNTSSALLYQFRPGEAIYNTDSGAESGNSRFQSFWMSDDELSFYLGAIRQLAYSHDDLLKRIQNIFDGSKNADVNQNRLLNALLDLPAWPTQQYATIWLGDPISLKETTNLQLRPRRGNNILIIGQNEYITSEFVANEEIASGLITIALFALGAQHSPKDARFYIVDGRPDTPYIDRLRVREKQFPHEVKVATRHTLSALLTEISNEIEDRAESDKHQKPSIYLFINGLHSIRDLRLEEKTPTSLTRQLYTILRDGPEHGIHTLIWCDKLDNFARSVEPALLNEFELRIAFQMSENDSTKLIGSKEATKLGTHRALLFNERIGSAEKFIPYEPPSDEWLTQAVDHLRQKSQ